MQRTYLIFTLFFLLSGYLLNSIYRPFAYANQINDFGLADAGNNLIFVPGIYFLNLLIRNKPILTYFNDILLILGFYLLVELLQMLAIIPGTFDFMDIIGLIIGALLTFVLSKRMHSL